jgi:hypothetical protein
MKEALSVGKGVEKEVIDQMAQFGIDTRNVHEQIICNEFNANTAVDRMLLKQKIADEVAAIVEASRTPGAPVKPARIMRMVIPVTDSSEIDPALIPAKHPPAAVPAAARPPPATRILSAPSPVGMQRRISRPMAVKKTIDISTPTVSHETPA